MWLMCERQRQCHTVTYWFFEQDQKRDLHATSLARAPPPSLSREINQDSKVPKTIEEIEELKGEEGDLGVENGGRGEEGTGQDVFFSFLKRLCPT